MEYVSIAQSRAGVSGSAAADYPAGIPEVAWKGAELDAYAKTKGYDISKAKTKKDKVTAIHQAADAAGVVETVREPAGMPDAQAGNPHTSADPAANTHPSGGDSAAHKPEEG